jgi:hypothetical protein
MSFVGNIVKGAVAGGVGTAAMDLSLYGRYRRDGGKNSLWRWEFAADVMSWDDASAPGQLGRKALRELTGDEPPDGWARPTTNVVHWATGIGWGMAYGALASAAPQHPWARALALGPVAWLSGYVVLPLAKVYKPIWKYDARTLAKDLSAHIVYGAAVGVAFGRSQSTYVGRRGHRSEQARNSIAGGGP